MPTVLDATISDGWGWGDSFTGSTSCCAGPITLRLTLTVRDPDAVPACPTPASYFGGRYVGSAEVTLPAAVPFRPRPPLDGTELVPVQPTGPEPAYRGGTAVVTLAAGPVGRAWLAETGPAMLAYARRVGAEFVVIGSDADDAHRYPLALKWKLFDLLAEYDRVVFLDADAVVAPDCPDLFAVVPAGELGVWDDFPRLTRSEWVQDETAAIAAAAGVPFDGPMAHCYNSGVIVCDRSHRGLFRPPAVPVPAYHCTEQHWFNLRCRELSHTIFPLPPALHWHPHVETGRATAFDGTWPGWAKVVHLVGIGDRAARLRAVAAALYPDGLDPLPACRHRGEEISAGAVAAAGLATSRHWFPCERPKFVRTGLPVSDCTSCGVAVGRRCGAGLCVGYVPAE